jgi:hypothetical protein
MGQHASLIDDIYWTNPYNLVYFVCIRENNGKIEVKRKLRKI